MRKTYKQEKHKFPDEYTKDIDKVIEKEMEYIRKHRAVNETQHPKDTEDDRVKKLWGLCISGGGIRSATLGLGAIQKMMREGVFKYFDYISTVSGGGFIGACMSSLLSSPTIAEDESSGLKNAELKTIEGEEIPLGVDKDDSPFLTRGKYDKDQRFYTPMHQLYHLLVHGEYLTRNRSWFSLDIKRFMSALLGGALSNILLFLLVILLCVSFLMTVLQIIGTDAILSYSITEDNFGYDPFSGYLSDLMEQAPNEKVEYFQYVHYRIIGMCFSIGFIFTLLYYWIGVNYVLERVKPLEERSHYKSFKDGFSSLMKRDGQFKEDRRGFLRNALSLLNYGVVKLYKFIRFRGNPKSSTITIDEIESNENKYDYLVKKVVSGFAIWTIIVSATVIFLMVVVQLNMFDPIIDSIVPTNSKIPSSFFLIFILPIFFALGILVFLMIMGMFPESEPDYERLIRSTYAGMYGGAFNTLLASFLVPIFLIGVFFYTGEYFQIDSSQYALVLSGATYLITANGGGGGNKWIPSFMERYIPGLRRLVLNLSILVFLFLAFHLVTRLMLEKFDELDFFFREALLQGKDSVFLGGYAFLTACFSFSFTKIRHWKFILTYSIIALGSIVLLIAVNERLSNGLMEQAPLFVMLVITAISLLIGYLFTIKNGFIYNLIVGGLVIFLLIFLYIKEDISIERFGEVELTPALFFIGSLLLIFTLGFFFLRRYRSTLLTFYQDRLTEAFLITDGQVDRSMEGLKKSGKPLVAMRNHENLLLKDLGGNNYRGPYHMLLASLNLKANYAHLRKDLKSGHFIFSKYFIGSDSTGYVATDKYDKGRTTLGDAMALSAAAVNSAMGSIGFFAQAFLVTLFNLRLGKWITNPWSYSKVSKFETEKNRRFNRLSYLIDEYTGNFSTRKEMVNVSDGGHTGDNLGLLPLLKRRCSTIVICDFEEDLNFTFESFNNALRLAYLEEGIWMHIDLAKLTPEDKDKKTTTERSIEIGKIYYPDNTRGKIIYIKSSISGESATNVLSYLRKNPNFPHQSTADQYFSNEQFEAYRSLGYDLGAITIDQIEEYRQVDWGDEDDYGDKIEYSFE